MAAQRNNKNNVGTIRSQVSAVAATAAGTLISVQPAKLQEYMSQSPLKAKIPDEKGFKERAASSRKQVKEKVEIGTYKYLGIDGNEWTYRGEVDPFRTSMEKSGFGTEANQDETIITSGYWKGNQLNGFGTHLSINGDWCEGEWKNGEMNGIGRKVFHNGDWYFGEFAGNQAYGYGTWYYAKVFGGGNIYQGEFEKDKRHGDGVYYEFVTGDIQDGEWRFDRLVDGVVVEGGGSKRYWKNGRAV